MRRPLRLLQAIAVVAALAAGIGVVAAGAPADSVPVSTSTTPTDTAPTDTTATTPTGSLVTPPAAPVVNTGTATAITTSGATANGAVDAEGLPTVYWIEYGPTTGYGTRTTTASAGAGASALSISAVLTDLPPGTTFHYRVAAANADGTAAGSDATFTTAAPPPVLSHPTIVGDTSSVSLAGSAAIKGACVGATSCSGSITLTHGGVTIGTSSSFAIAPHGAKTLQIAVDAYGRKLLMANPGGIAAEVTILNGDKPLAHKRVTLAPDRPMSHHDRLRPLP